MPMLSLFAEPVAAVAAIISLFASLKIFRQYERAVVFASGKFQTVKGPGLGPDSGHV